MNSTNNRNPLLLVHGIWDTMAIFNTMSPYLRELGWSVYGLNLTPNNGALGLDKLAEQVADYAEKTFGREQPFDLVGFSMGGIVSRYYVQRLGGINRVQRFVTISSPHNGTLTGYALPLPGSIQMRTQSEFLRDLNKDAVAMLGQLNFTSIWTPYDFMIVPAISSKMPVGQDVQLPVLVHRLMVSDIRSLQAVASALSAPLRRAGEARPYSFTQVSQPGDGSFTQVFQPGEGSFMQVAQPGDGSFTQVSQPARDGSFTQVSQPARD